MKKKLVPIVLVLILTACASANLTAYKTIGSLVTAVDLARGVWDDYVNAEKAKPQTPEQKAALDAKIVTVQHVYLDYLAAIKAVQTSQPGFSAGAPVPSQLTVAAGALLKMIETMRAN